MIYPVKYYNSETLTLEPILSGTAGSRITRTVKQGIGIAGGDSFRIQIRGDANG